MPSREAARGGGASTNLVAMQERLNRDPKLKKAFLDNPSAVMKEAGFELNREQETSLAYLVDRVKRPGQLVPGAGVAPQDLAAIRITIGVDF